MWKWIKRLFRKKPRPTVIQKDRPSPVDISQPSSPLVKVDYPFDFYYPRAKTESRIGILPTHTKHKKLPKYMIVHHTAGHQDQKAVDFLQWLKDTGLCTFFIDHTGQAWQNHHGNTVGWHIGDYPKINGRRIYKDAAGVEIAAGGLLKTNNKTWFNRSIPSNQIRTVTKRNGYKYAGSFQKFTEAQEKELALFLKWCLLNGTEVILGHDELLPNPKWKNDPSGSLSLPLHKWLKKYVY